MKVLFSLLQANFKLIATKVDCYFNPELVNVTCHHELFANDSYSLSFRFRVLEDAEKLFVRVAIALPTTDGDYKSIIANTVQELCKYIKNANNNPLLKLFFNGNFDKKRIPTSCPVRAGDYYVENFRLCDSIHKMRIIETKFLVTVEFCLSEMITWPARDCTASLRIYGEIREFRKMRKAAAVKV